ncbi:RmlC-like cupin domain-containing protein [Xylariaceae sp. FL1019]|nr:RmlC-like cupin domain-containing protein [Xylariaceae sp. FL1019]
MVRVKKYQLPSTPLVPNSPQPLLHYSGVFRHDDESLVTKAHDMFSENGWEVQWIFRYGPTQPSHFHSRAHECMAVLSGNATIRFGVADANEEGGGLEVEAHAGDVFVIPAGVAHKTFNASPVEEFKLLTPGDGHGVAADDVRAALADIRLSGFTMLGAYPKGCTEWDFVEYERDADKHKASWNVEKPPCDPVIGKGAEGLCGIWS